MVDLYYSLYGAKRPTCLPQDNDDLARLYKPQKVEKMEDIKKIESIEVEKTEVIIEETIVAIDEKVEIVEELKKEQIDEDMIPVTEIIPLDEPLPAPLLPSVSPPPSIPPEKKAKLEYFSENSISLPGVSAGFDQDRPVGFEPGMFDKKDSDDTGDPNKEKLKKKKKDKKKHKHKKHKHKSKDHDQPIEQL